ncbi:MAG: hypothetical protein U0746_14070 [Gemmataceae bacterium]
MADKLTQLLLTALGKAALAPGGAPLHATRSASGLFPATAGGKSAAQRAQDEGLIAAGSAGGFAATARGMAYLIEHTSPRQVLEDLARAVESRQVQVADLIAAAKAMAGELSAVQALLVRLSDPRAPSPVTATGVAEAPSTDWLPDARAFLNGWSSDTDCPLPALYERLLASHPTLTVGQFHDGLRRLRDDGDVYLHPWTGPLYAMPEPTLALLSGHEIAYYASSRIEQRSRGAGEQERTAFSGPRLLSSAPLLPCSPA